jgi:hypothetical protein
MSNGIISKKSIKLFFDYTPWKLPHLKSTGVYLADLYGEVGRLADKDLERIIRKLEQFPETFDTRVVKAVRGEQKYRKSL